MEQQPQRVVATLTLGTTVAVPTLESSAFWQSRFVMAEVSARAEQETPAPAAKKAAARKKPGR